MATLLQDEGVIEVDVVLVGSESAVSLLWQRLVRFTRIHEGEDTLVISEQRTAYSPVGPLSDFLFRIRLKRLEISDGALSTQRWVEALNGADGVMVALDVSPEEGAGTRLLCKHIEQAMHLMDPQGWTRARALLGVGPYRPPGEGAPQEWTELRVWWHRHGGGSMACSVLTSQVDDEFAGEALHAVGTRIREKFAEEPPGLHPIYPQQDLLPEQRDEAEKHRGNMRRAEPEARSHAFFALSEMYAKVGQTTAARGLLRRAFETHRAVKIWESRPQTRPPIQTLERLRQWELGRQGVGDIAMMPGGQTLLVSVGKTLLRAQRNAEAFDELWTFDYDVRRMIVIDSQRMVCVHDKCIRILTIDRDFGMLAEAEVPAAVRQMLERQRDPRMAAKLVKEGDCAFKAHGFEVKVNVGMDRLLLVTRVGLWLYSLKDMKLIQKVERNDILEADFADKGGIWTVHEQGSVGLWTPGSSVWGRVANFPARLRDASIGVGRGLVAGLAEGGSTIALMVVSLKTGQMYGEGSPTVNAMCVKLAEGGERALTFEERYLRVRDLTAGPLGERTPVRTLLTPPPWVPVRVAWLPGERQVAALAKSYVVGGQEPLKVYLWS
jgi:hypothetical protein